MKRKDQNFDQIFNMNAKKLSIGVLNSTVVDYDYEIKHNEILSEQRPPMKYAKLNSSIHSSIKRWSKKENEKKCISIYVRKDLFWIKIMLEE